MYKVGIIGDIDSIMGFKAVGMEVWPVENAAEAAGTLATLAESEYAVIFITENIAVQIKEAIDVYKDEKLPAIVPVPSIAGTEGLGAANIKRWVERAVGADIISK